MQNAVPIRVQLGAFELDLKAGELRQGASRVRLQKQPFQILLMLVEASGEMVSREEIQKRLWPNDTIVEFDHSIHAAIRNLRRALGDSADSPKYVETVARRGYRLMVPVQCLESSSGDGGGIPSPSASSGQAPSPKPAGAPPFSPQAKGWENSTFLTGRTASHYRVLEIIGGGGMGMVYEAEDLKLGRRVALKFLPEELASDAIALQRFEREARTASSLNHANICYIHEFGEHEGQPFIAMELLEGETLRDRLAADEPPKPLPLNELLAIAVQTCEGLQAAHEKAVIHRDIKPANIFLTSKGVVKILDFGLAKLVEGEKEPPPGVIPSAERSEASRDPYTRKDLGAIEVPRLAAQTPGRSPGMTHENSAAAEACPGPALRDEAPLPPALSIEHTLTRTGVAMGTAGYMSPEQVRGERLDVRTDIFSFGLVLYEMASGQRAFTGQTVAVVHDAILNNSPIPVRELNSALPAKLATAIDKALEKEREKRFQSAAEIRTELHLVNVDKEPVVHKLFHHRIVLAAITVLFLAVAITGALYWRWRKATDFAEKDTIVLADFTNTTADPVFDDSIIMAVDVALEQTPWLNFLSMSKTRETLRMMGHREDEPITPAMAQEICRLTNSKAFLAPSISDAGERYHIELKAVNCHSGRTLATAETEAGRRSDVVRMIGVAGRELRSKLGEPRASLDTFNQPVETFQSASPEALQAVRMAKRAAETKGDIEAIPYLQRAVDLDPQFARAYTMLASFYSNVGENNLAAQNALKAYQLRDRLGQRNRFRTAVETNYFMIATGELDKAAATILHDIQTLPHSSVGYANLGSIFLNLGQYEKAVPALQESIRLYPDGVYPYWNVMDAYLGLNQLEEAATTFEQARARKLDGAQLRDARYRLAFLRSDRPAMQEQVAWAKGHQGAEDLLLAEESDTEAFHGRFAAARRFSQRAADSAKAAKSAETAANWEAREAWREAEIGKASAVAKETAEALKLKPTQSVRVLTTLALARSGNAREAVGRVAELNHDFPLDTLIQNYWLPCIRAAIALAERNPGEAVRVLETAKAFELAMFWGTLPTMQPGYLRGEAYLEAGQGQQAAAEFQTVLTHSGVAVNFLSAALAHLQLARAQVMMGDKDAARKSYQDFLILWKDADRDIPIYQQAKGEYAKLGIAATNR